MLRCLSPLHYLVVLVLALSFGGSRDAASPAPDLVPALVTRVVDGDTIICDVDGVKTRVRLIGVDTPETVHPQKPVEAFGAEASAYTKSMLDGQAVSLEYDVERTDRYGRDLCYVWLADGTMFNDLLLIEGFATVATYPPNVKYVERFTESARLARERGAGLYAPDS